MGEKVLHEVLTRLDALAAKLGTTAVALWGVLVAQGRVEGWQYLCWAAFWLIPIAIAIWFFNWVVRHPFKNDDKICGSVFIGLAMLGSIALFFNCLVTGLGFLLNPQYWAWHQLVETLK